MTQLRTLHQAPALLVPDQVLLPEGPQSGHAILVADGRILAVGPLAEVADQVPTLLAEAHAADARGTAQTEPQVTRIDLPGRLLMPGFVDAHHHLTQTFGKSLVFGEPSEIFQRVWVPMESNMDAEAIDVATRLAAWESLRGGFTTVADAGTRSSVDVSAISDVTTDVGLRCVLGVICNDLGGGVRTSTVAEVVSAAETHLTRWDAESLVHPSLAVSIPEVASDEALVEITRMAREAGVPFQTHLNEHIVAVERSLNLDGRTSAREAGPPRGARSRTARRRTPLCSPRARSGCCATPAARSPTTRWPARGRATPWRPPCSCTSSACASDSAPTAPARTPSASSTPPRPRSG
jgi:5-methylthioadenosine/S-adenosylhomocysteine deaminase